MSRRPGTGTRKPPVGEGDRANLLRDAFNAKDILAAISPRLENVVLVYMGGRYPTHSVVVSEAGYSWGDNYEHAAPVDMKPIDVASAVLETKRGVGE